MKVDDVKSALCELENVLGFPLKGSVRHYTCILHKSYVFELVQKLRKRARDEYSRLWYCIAIKRHWLWHIIFLYVCDAFLGFVPGTTSVRKAHQIPVDSLVSYLQKELGLHQGGSIKNFSFYWLLWTLCDYFTWKLHDCTSVICFGYKLLV